MIGFGILNCELYIGVIRWNRQKLKNPDTGHFAYRYLKRMDTRRGSRASYCAAGSRMRRRRGRTN